MADTGVFASTSHVVLKAGAGVNGTAATSTSCNIYLADVESQINAACRYNFTDNYTSLNNDTKMILREAASNMGAIYAISYDMSGYTSRIEAEDMINVLRDVYLRDLALLKDKKVTDFIREV